jgi:hypothetical protein
MLSKGTRNRSCESLILWFLSLDTGYLILYIMISSGSLECHYYRQAVSSNLGGEVGILDVERGMYYGLDPAGAQVWNLIQKPQSVAEVRESMLRESDAEPSQFESDLIALLEKLLAEGLIELKSSLQEWRMART